jgi:signal transduction histidine kinase
MRSNLPIPENHANPAEARASSEAPRALSSDIPIVAAERPRPRLLPYVIFALGLVITSVLTAYLSATADTRDARRFRAVVEQTQASLESRLDLYVALLQAGTELVAAQPSASAEDLWGDIAALKLHRPPNEVRRVGVVRKVAPADRARFELEARRRSAAFRIWPEPTGDAFPILDVEPFDGRVLPVSGFDMSSDPVRRAAMEQARDTGVPVATDRVTMLVPWHPAGLERCSAGSSSTPYGLLIYAPIYEGGVTPDTVEARRAALFGFVYLVFRADDLFRGLLSDREHPRSVDVAIYAGASPLANHLLHRSSAGSPKDSSVAPRFTSASTLEIASKPFTLSFMTRPEFERGSSKALVPLILGAGTLLSVVLFLSLRSLNLARAEAEHRAMELLTSERALREGEVLLQRLSRAESLARSSAEVASRVRDEFLATLSHELRTPLTAMMGWARMLRGGALDAAASVRGLAVIDRNITLLAQLIDDLLDVSQIITGKLHLTVRRVMIARLVEAAMAAMRPAADARAIHLSATFAAEDVWVTGDPDRLQQVLWNLLSNAIRFTPSGGRVEVRVARAAGQVEISVADDGKGIAPEFVPFVFDRFRQADSSVSRAASGLGLGLAIVRHLVELHGGTVSVESPGEGHGATFTVLLPETLSLTPQGDPPDCGDGSTSQGSGRAR